jgi:hypothetical protein
VRRLYVLIGVAILVFLAISALLARAFSADGAEQSAITALVRDEAAGRTPQAIGRIVGCAQSAGCRARVTQEVAALRRPGAVSILQVAASTGFSLTGTVGVARVAYTIGSSLPIVQCVRVHRAGDVLSGLRIELLELSPKIKSDADCPARF